MARTRTNAKANEKVNAKANKGGRNMKTTMEQMEAILSAVQGIQTSVTSLEKRIVELENANGTAKTSAKKNAPKTKETKKSAPKGKGKSTRKSAPAKAEPVTKAEAIEQWKSARYTAEERAEYGIAAKEVRDEMMAENAKMVKVVKGKKVYDDNYYAGAKWKKEFAKRMKARGFGK